MSFLSSLGHALSSKTVWGAVALGAVNTLPTLAPFVQGTPIGVGINLALTAFTIYGRVRAHQPLGPVIDSTIAQTVDAVHQLQGTPQALSALPAVKAMVKATPTGELPSEQPLKSPGRAGTHINGGD